MACTLDHVVIGADELEAGAAQLDSRLGIALSPGGEHPVMATHNRCTGTGGATYLELMAPVPGKTPDRPRWLELDVPTQRARIAAAPRPIAWMIATPDLDSTLAAARAQGLELGEPLALSRGPYSWRVAIPPDGARVEGGTVPVPVEWHGDAHPSRDLPDRGVRYDALSLTHPEPERLRAVLDALEVEAPVAVEAGESPGLAVALRRPDGGQVHMA